MIWERVSLSQRALYAASILLTFFVFTAVIIVALKYISKWSSVRQQAEYLVSLRENSVVGCSTFLQRKPKLLILGDSHSYSAFDFLLLSQLSGHENISSCTMGGLYFETVLEIIDRVEPGQILIYGSSLRQFTTGSDKEKQLAEHQKLLSEGERSTRFPFAEIRRNLFENRYKVEDAGSPNIHLRSMLIDKWSDRLSQIDVAETNWLFEHLNNQSKTLFVKYLDQLIFEENVANNIFKFCEAVKAKRIELIVVDIPESPYLQKLYTQEALSRYDKILSQLSSCSLRLVRFKSDEWSQDSRNFVNRNMNDSWDIYKLRALEFDEDTLNNAYNMDHMNLIGAQKFTREFYAQIQDIVNHAF